MATTREKCVQVIALPSDGGRLMMSTLVCMCGHRRLSIKHPLRNFQRPGSIGLGQSFCRLRRQTALAVENA